MNDCAQSVTGSHAASVVLHWYDFVCPFCYVGQSRTQIPESGGLHIAELPFQAHPEIPETGQYIGPRSGGMYELLQKEADAAGLPLHWPSRLPNTRRALACAEWVRQHEPHLFKPLQESYFAAHFAEGEDLGDLRVLEKRASMLGVNVARMRAALQDGSAPAAVDEAEQQGRSFGVRGTPAWLVGSQLIAGLLPAVEFERLLTRDYPVA